jgi:hypothetical protein
MDNRSTEESFASFILSCRAAPDGGAFSEIRRWDPVGRREVYAPENLDRVINELDLASTLLLKADQGEAITEALKVVTACRENKYHLVVMPD